MSAAPAESVGFKAAATSPRHPFGGSGGKMDNTDHFELIGQALTLNDLDCIVTQIAKPGSEIVDYHFRPASEEGIEGFVGDHFKMTITVKKKDQLQKIHLFIKTLPIKNKPKADFIVQNKFFRREDLMFKLLKDMQEMDSQNCWHTTAFVHNDRLLVMPDLSVHGYKTYPVQSYLDKSHLWSAVSSLARFHASFARSITKRQTCRNDNYNFLSEHGDVMTEPTFCDSPWLRAAAKLTSNFLREFSSAGQQHSADLEKKLWNLFIKGCESLREYEETLNVIIHKDLWANNILFKYSGEEVTNAVLVDFQCIRYAPPAFDLMTLLHLTTSKSFRERYEDEVLLYYYKQFTLDLDELTKKRLQALNYDQEAFLVWCEKARLFGMVVAIAIFPFILMEPAAAQLTFDDPVTFLKYLEVDRSDPVVAHARQNLQYRNRQLEICEDFFDKYVEKYELVH